MSTVLPRRRKTSPDEVTLSGVAAGESLPRSPIESPTVSAHEASSPESNSVMATDSSAADAATSVTTAPNAAAPATDSGRLRANMRSSVADGISYNIMVGMGELFIAPYALAIGLGEVAAGLIISVPVLIGSLLQLISPFAIRGLGSNRLWVICCVVAQAASFLPLVLAAFVGKISLVLAFGVVSVYWAASLAAGPAWNAWMEHVIPASLRASFFAWRTRLGQVGMLLGFAIGGLSLEYGRSVNAPLAAFAILFCVAAVARFVSAFFLARQSESREHHNHQQHVPVMELCRRIWAGGSERMLVYFLLVQLAAQISGPFFTPYMLRQLHFSYTDYMLLLGVSLVAKIVALPAFGRVAHRFGARRLVWMGGVGIVPISAMWLWTDDFYGLMVVQFLAGVTWAAYELAMMLLFFETVRSGERTSILTVFNVANAAALTVGSLLAGAFLTYFDKSAPAYLAIFGFSSVARGFALIALWLTVPTRRRETRNADDAAVDPTLLLASPSVHAD